MGRSVWVCAAIVCAAAGAAVRAQSVTTTTETTGTTVTTETTDTTETTETTTEQPAYAGCVHEHSARVRVVVAAEACRPNETRIDWTITPFEEPIVLPSGDIK